MKFLRGLGFMLGTVVLYLGLSLLGWGLGGLGSYFASVERLAYSIIVGFFALAVGYQAIDAPEGIQGSRGQEAKLVSRQTAIGSLAVALLALALLLLPFADRRGIGVMVDSHGVRSPGLIPVVLGYGMVFLSGLYLGRQYSADVTIQQDHQLITNGPYRYVRHPRYLGILLLAVGFSLTFRSWIGLAASPVILGLLLFRIKDEEALMHAEFRQEWERYCERSWRLVPFVF